jgi:hypothetical protein
MLVWDDQSKRGDDWWSQQNIARSKIRQLLRTEDNGFDLIANPSKVKMDIKPSINTSIGPINYPSRITVVDKEWK